MVIVQLNGRLKPFDRGEYFEDPLDAALQRTKRGSVTGAGTMLAESGEVSHCDIELGLLRADEEDFQFIAATLEDLGAPRGSKLTMKESGIERALGKAEGLAVYLNGTDLPDEVYRTSDVNFVISEFTRLLGKTGRILSNWEGPAETALYMYGASFAGMRGLLGDFIAGYPLCQKCRIVQIA